MRGKKGFLRVLEAGIAIVLLLGFILFFSMPTYVEKKDIDKEVYKTLDYILDEIERNLILRGAVRDNDFNVLYEFLTPELDGRSLDGVIAICNLDQPCTCNPDYDDVCELEMESSRGKDIYVRERAIVITLEGDSVVKKIAIRAWTLF